MQSKRLQYREQMILAPRSARIPDTFGKVQYQPALYDMFLADMQRLRGRAYVKDGAIQPHLLRPATV